MRAASNQTLQEMYKIKDSINMSNKALDFIIDRIQKLDEDLQQLNKSETVIKNKIEQLEKDKKSFAAAKRFKDAGRCQADLKDSQSELENIQLSLKKTEDNKA